MAKKVRRVDFTRKGKWLSLLFIGFTLYFCIIMINQQFTLKNLSQRKQELNNEIQQLEDQNSELRSQVDLLRTDNNYIEGIARQKLGLVREGETVYILPQRTTDD